MTRFLVDATDGGRARQAGMPTTLVFAKRTQFGICRFGEVKLMTRLLADAESGGWAWQAGMPVPTLFRETNPIGRKIHDCSLLRLGMVHMAKSVLSDGMDGMDETDWFSRRTLRFRETNPIGHKSDSWIVSYDLEVG